jgi:hypothetical protein
MPSAKGNNIPFTFGQASTSQFTKKMGRGHEIKKKLKNTAGANVKKHGAPPFPMGLAHGKHKHHGHAAIQKAAGRRLFGGGTGQNQFFQKGSRNNEGRLNA